MNSKNLKRYNTYERAPLPSSVDSDIEMFLQGYDFSLGEEDCANKECMRRNSIKNRNSLKYKLKVNDIYENDDYCDELNTDKLKDVE